MGLRASPGDGSVALAWQPCSEDDVWTYRVYWGSDPASLSNSAEVPASTAQYTVAGLADFTTYYFAVSVVDLAGHEGARSAVVSAVPGVYIYLPITMRQ
ncbi:MAG: fibronectin type III domain-containing protein [Anaerolineae bacterium]